MLECGEQKLDLAVTLVSRVLQLHTPGGLVKVFVPDTCKHTHMHAQEV